jgi:hypothetical protein
MSGLRLRVALDRGFDIDELEFRGRQIGWHGPGGAAGPGIAAPDQEDGTGLLRAFSGFMITCGYDTFGGARTGPADHFGYALRPRQHYPLHGRASFLPAELLGARIDWDDAEGPTAILHARMRQAGLFGENLSCARRIRIAVETGRIEVEDTVRNDGMTRAPHRMLYHLNLGHPLIDAGTSVSGLPEDPAMPAILPELPQPRAEAFRFVPREDCARAVRVTAPDGLSLAVEPASPSLRYVGQWWNHYDGMECMGIEPASASMPGPDAEGTLDPLLEPGEAVTYRFVLRLSEGRGA